MRNFNTVLRFEYVGRIRSKRYIYLTVGLAVLALILACLPLLVGGISSLFGGGDEDAVAEDAAAGDLDPAAYCDLTGLYTPEVLAAYSGNFTWTPVSDAGELEAGIEAGDYDLGLLLTDGAATLYLRGVDAMYTNTSRYYDMVKAVTQSAMLEEAGLDPVGIEPVLAVDPVVDYVTVGRDASQSYGASFAVVILLYMAIAFYGQSVSTSVSTEKTSRAIELLTISTDPYSLIFGKVLATGLAGLTQLAGILLPAGVAVYFGMDAWMEFSPEIGGVIEMFFASGGLGYALLFFLLSFFTYAFVFAALTSTISRAEDLSGSQMLPTLLLMAAYLVSMAGLFTPDALYLRILSFVPFFSPLVMLMRVTMTEVALLELILSIGASLLYIVLLGVLSAKIYRVGVMLTGNRPSLRQVFKLMRES